MKSARGLHFTGATPPPEPVIGRVAKALLGLPNPYLSKQTEWHYHYGAHGTLKVDLINNTWHDSDTHRHGVVLDLINHVIGGDHADARRWLDQRFGAAHASLVDHALAAPADNTGKNRSTAKDDAIQFLRAALAEGPRSVQDVEIEAHDIGLLPASRPISQCKPIRAARDALGVKAYQRKGEKAAGWFWTLPHQMPSETEANVAKGI
jgi:hypothetical protein